MTYLKDIIQKRQGQLAAADAKLVKQLCNKITDSYYPDEKIVEKLRKFSTCLTTKKSIVVNWFRSHLSTTMASLYSQQFLCLSTIKTGKY